MLFIFLYILQIFFIAAQCGNGEHYGRFMGDFKTFVHNVTGKVYVVDEDTFYIKDFTYDGKGPAAHFRVSINEDRDQSGTFVAYPAGFSELEPLRGFDNPQDIVVDLPVGRKIEEFSWFYIWCSAAAANFGEVKIPSSLAIPRKRELVPFERYAHGLRSGKIKILDSRTFYIPNLHYDGAGPAAYFWVGKGKPNSKGRKIPDENGSLEPLNGYQGANIEITLPKDLTVYDIDYLSMYCEFARQNFGHVIIPKDLDVPPYVKTEVPSTRIANCANFLQKRVQLQWETAGDMVTFTLSGRIQEKQWVAVGFSPTLGRVVMVGGDAIVAYMTPNGKFHADDYYMSAKSQCDGTEGVCLDTNVGGKNDVEMLSGLRKNGVTKVVFRRPITTTETKYDRNLKGEVSMYVAMGNLNSKTEANAHNSDDKSLDKFQIDVSATALSDYTCPGNLEDSLATIEPKVRAWHAAVIEGVREFNAKIGPTGGKRGYTALTGNPSWGIAWYINDMLIPEIFVERGKTYNFTIQGGDNNDVNTARYHPFYITLDSEGGFFRKSKEQQNAQIVYAGVGKNESGEFIPTAAGQYCEWRNKKKDQSLVSETFQEFMKTLKLYCEHNSEPGHLSWTVAKDTPDTVYYQCYTHFNLGWKIHVNDPGYKMKRKPVNPMTQKRVVEVDSKDTKTGGVSYGSKKTNTLMLILTGIVTSLMY